MKFDEAEKFLAEFEDQVGDILSIKSNEINGFNHKSKSFVTAGRNICFPIITSHSFNKSKDPDVKFPNNRLLGRILFLKDKELSLDALTREQLLCLLSEKPDRSLSSSYKFRNDYLVIKTKSLRTYFNKYRNSSPIWGDFLHVQDKPTITFSQTYRTGEIQAIENIEIDYSLYLENLFLSLVERNPFQRFLKLYHLLEMQFDLHTAEQIKFYLSKKKYREISSKLNQYGREELNRLESIIKDYCTDTKAIAKLMNNVDIDKTTAVDLFYYPGKASTPKKNVFLDILNRPNKFLDRSYITGPGLGYTYDTTIHKTCSYWIYRVRSSIAHNRYGEYILSSSKEDFIVKFAEPLLKEVIRQCFIK